MQWSKRSLFGLVGAAALSLGLAGPAVAQTQPPIRIGILVAVEGAFAAGGADGVRNVELALRQVNNTAGGRRIETVVAPTDTRPDTAVRQARRLLEQDRVDFVIGPLSGSEGLAIRDFAKTVPDRTFINGISGAMEMTFVDPAPNVFRFNLDGNQWGAGLGRFAVQQRNIRRIATVAADYSFGHTNLMGFAVDFCRAGGTIVQRFWVPLGATDFGGVIAQLPDNIDAVYLGLGGTDAINFLNQWQQAGAGTRILGGTIMADPTVLTARGRARNALIGALTSGPIAEDNTSPAWQAYVRAYQEAFPANQRFPTPSLFGVGYYIATQAAIAALNAVNGDLSDGQRRFNAALSQLRLATPLGEITLNENRQATGTVFINEVAEGPGGTLVNRNVGRQEGVTQTLGMDLPAFRALGLPSRTNPDCRALGGG